MNATLPVEEGASAISWLNGYGDLKKCAPIKVAESGNDTFYDTKLKAERSTYRNNL